MSTVFFNLSFSVRAAAYGEDEGTDRVFYNYNEVIPSENGSGTEESVRSGTKVILIILRPTIFKRGLMPPFPLRTPAKPA